MDVVGDHGKPARLGLGPSAATYELHISLSSSRMAPRIARLSFLLLFSIVSISVRDSARTLF